MLTPTAGNPVTSDDQILNWFADGINPFPYFEYSPIYSDSLNLLLAGEFARNMGMILGLRGWYSLLPLIAMLSVVSLYFLRLGTAKKPD